jgi:hypothetical protein
VGLGKSGPIMPRRDDDCPFKGGKSLMPCFQENLLSFRLFETVPQTDTGGQVENTKALERTRVKELGKMVP